MLASSTLTLIIVPLLLYLLLCHKQRKEAILEQRTA